MADLSGLLLVEVSAFCEQCWVDSHNDPPVASPQDPSLDPERKEVKVIWSIGLTVCTAGRPRNRDFAARLAAHQADSC